MRQGIATAEAGIDQTLGIGRIHVLFVVVSGLVGSVRKHERKVEVRDSWIDGSPLEVSLVSISK
jgi:hypothetical protein